MGKLLLEIFLSSVVYRDYDFCTHEIVGPVRWRLLYLNKRV